MELLNATGMHAGYTMGMQPDGRELLVVIVKGTFGIPEQNDEPKLVEDQFPIIEADTFTGEPGLSAPIYESDYAPVKRRCDVLLAGSAYAPAGLASERVRVALRVGQMYKTFDVVGERQWSGDTFGVAATAPEPFTVKPISYDVAFGGMDNVNPDPGKHEAYVANPIGKGFYPRSNAGQIVGRFLPNTEEPGRMVGDPRGSYKTMGFGPIGRSWYPRPEYAGTYDQNWIDNVFPFLPADFDERYYQCAPLDQQIDLLRGDEEVMLLNLTAQGQTTFRLPRIDVPVTFYLKNYDEKEVSAAGDTLIIEPDLGRFMIVWRASIPLRRNMFEVAQVIAGRMPRGWYRARKLGKTYYPSLQELVNLRRAERAETAERTEEAEEVKESEV
jgi:hypothetical protein